MRHWHNSPQPRQVCSDDLRPKTCFLGNCSTRKSSMHRSATIESSIQFPPCHQECWTVLCSFKSKGKPLSMCFFKHFYFHPYLEKIPILTSIFFRWVGSTTNQLYCSLFNFSVLSVRNECCSEACRWQWKLTLFVPKESTVSRWRQLKYLLFWPFLTPIPREVIQFDNHIFTMGRLVQPPTRYPIIDGTITKVGHLSSRLKATTWL